MRSYAILVDAGFLKPKIGSQETPADAEKIIDFIEQLKNSEPLRPMRLHRIYYYDAPPLDKGILHPMTGERLDVAHNDLAKRNHNILKTLAKQPFYASRLGQCHDRGWKLKRGILKKADLITIHSDSVVPNIQQKGVDMRIGLDIATLTLKKQVDVIVLVTGDSDFIPAMKYARREGAQLFLVRLGHRVLDELIEHADLDLELTK